MRGRLVALIVLVATVPSAAAEDAAVSIQGFAFDPSPLALSGPGVVTWTNNDFAPHTATSLASPADFDTGPLDTAASGAASLALGTHPYRCDIHTSMLGLVQVGPQSAPSVSVDLADGAVVSGVVTLTGSAPDAEGPHTWVAIDLDGATITPGSLGIQTADSDHAWAFSFDTLALANGAHSLVLVATDGGLSATLPLTIVVENAPAADLRVVAFAITNEDPATKRLTATIRNEGNVGAPPASVAFETLVGGEWRAIGSGELTLAQGSQGTVAVTWSVLGKVGTWTLRAVADANGAIAESDETNNVAARQVVLVVAGAPIDLLDP